MSEKLLKYSKKHFERAGVVALDERIKYAQETYIISIQNTKIEAVNLCIKLQRLIFSILFL